MPTSHQCPTMHLVDDDTYAYLAEALDFLQPDSVLACVGCGLASSILVANLEANGSGNDNLSDLGLPIQQLLPKFEWSRPPSNQTLAQTAVSHHGAKTNAIRCCSKCVRSYEEISDLHPYSLQPISPRGFFSTWGVCG